jgi:hypothetical protein
MNWTVLTRDHPKCAQIVDTAPRMVFLIFDGERPPPSKLSWEDPEACQRIKVALFVESTPGQSYCTKLLHLRCHGQLDKVYCEKMAKNLESNAAKRNTQGLLPTRVVWICSGDYKDEYIRVSNDLSHREFWPTLEEDIPIALEKMAKNGAKNRGHSRLDVGSCGYHNQQRCPILGLPRPRQHAKTFTELGRKMLTQAWSMICSWYGKTEAEKEVYNDPAQQKELANRYSSVLGRFFALGRFSEIGQSVTANSLGG